MKHLEDFNVTDLVWGSLAQNIFFYSCRWESASINTGSVTHKRTINHRRLAKETVCSSLKWQLVIIIRNGRQPCSSTSLVEQVFDFILNSNGDCAARGCMSVEVCFLLLPEASRQVVA